MREKLEHDLELLRVENKTRETEYRRVEGAIAALEAVLRLFDAEAADEAEAAE